MKYVNETIINLPIDKVIQLFDDTSNMYEWMDGLLSHEHTKGTPGEVGAQMKMMFEMGKEAFEITETITEKNLPQSFAGTYDSKYALNFVRNKFQAISSSQTKFLSQTTVTPKSFMVKLMTWIAPKTFKDQSQKYLDNFKKFAESQV